jgi:hypothetical protein
MFGSSRDKRYHLRQGQNDIESGSHAIHSALTPNPSPSGRGEPEAPLRESRFWKPDLV